MYPLGKNRTQTIFILMLMTLALLLKAFVPAGFMPEAGNGFMKMVICSGMGEKTVYVPVDENSPQNEEHAASGDHCPYQTLTAAKFIPAPAPSVIDEAKITGAALVAKDAPALHNLHIHSIAARGPPSSLI